MKYYEGTQTLNFTWEQVANGFWHRYPNPYSKHVLTEDTVSRRVVGQTLHSSRFVTKMSKVPSWGERFFSSGPKFVCVVEESVLDPVSRTLTTYTRNVGMTRVMLVEERCEYTPLPDASTLCKRSAWISSSVYGFSYALQTVGLERFKANIKKSILGYDHVLNKMFPREVVQLTSAPGILHQKKEFLQDKVNEKKELLQEKVHEKTELFHEKVHEKKELLHEKAEILKSKAQHASETAKEFAKERVEKAKELKTLPVVKEIKEKTEIAKVLAQETGIPFVCQTEQDEN